MATCGVSQGQQTFLGESCEFFNHFDGEDLSRELGQDGRLITEPRADLEHRLVRLRIEEIRHQGADERLGNGLVEADRERHVVVGHGSERRWHEKMPAEPLHRRGHPRVEPVFADLVTHEIEVDGDHLDHVPAKNVQVLSVIGFMVGAFLRHPQTRRWWCF